MAERFFVSGRNAVPGYIFGKGKKSGGCGVATAPARYFQKIKFRRTVQIQELPSLKPDLWPCHFR